MRRTLLILCLCITLAVPVSAQMDYGDAPDPPYPSLQSSNGSRHADFTKALLGERVNGEKDSRQKNEDDYDDSIISISPFKVLVTNNDMQESLYLNILIDTNQDGDWEDAGEWALRNEEVNVPEGESEEVAVPVNLSAEVWLNAGLRGSTRTNISTWVRISLTAEEIPSYSGHGSFEVGETEDQIFRLHTRNRSTTCGNGVIETGEQCDPPQARPCPAAGQVYCNANCQLVTAKKICGDGCKEGAEECDMAGKAPGKPPILCKPGQGVCNPNTCKCIQPPPQNKTNKTICGNNELEKGEECERDDQCGWGEVCTDDCTCKEKEEETVCGNDELETGEECETDSHCPAAEMCNQQTCECEEGVTTAYCGNDHVERAEECENDADCEEGEVCTENCNCVEWEDDEPVCGNEEVELGEECENSGHCARDEVCENCECKEGKVVTPFCGNDNLEDEEECEQDKHCGENEYCSENCNCVEGGEEEPVCGNEEIEPGEECESANDCPMHNQECYECECRKEFSLCGNDELETGEECDGSSVTCDEGEVCSDDCTCIGKGINTTGRDETELLCGNEELDEGEECETDAHCDGKQVCILCNCIGEGIIDEGPKCDPGKLDLPPFNDEEKSVEEFFDEACMKDSDCGEGEVCQNCQCVEKDQEQASLCGNGIVEEGEACDPPTGPSCPTGEKFCNSNCQWEVWTQSCGDGCVEGNEQCDLGQDVKGADPVNCDGNAICQGCRCITPTTTTNGTEECEGEDCPDEVDTEIVDMELSGIPSIPDIDPPTVDFDATVTGGNLEDELSYEWSFKGYGKTEAGKNESGENASRNKSAVLPSFIGDRFELRLEDKSFGVSLEGKPQVSELGTDEEFSAPVVVKTNTRTVNRIINSDSPMERASKALKSGKIDIQGRGVANQVKYGMLEAFGRIGMKFFQDDPYDVKKGEEKTVNFGGEKATLTKNELGQKVVKTKDGENHVINDEGEVVGSIPNSTERLVNDRPEDCSETAGVYSTSGNSAPRSS